MAAPVTSPIHIVADSLKKTPHHFTTLWLVRLCPIILIVGNMNDFRFTNANTHYFFVYVEVQKEPKRRQHFAYWLLDLTEEDPCIDIQKLTVFYESYELTYLTIAELTIIHL